MRAPQLKINVDETACWEKCGKSFRKYVVARAIQNLV
jgi:hypothetical protein